MLDPGVLVIVHDPEAGSPDKITVPDGVAQVGCVMAVSYTHLDVYKRQVTLKV